MANSTPVSEKELLEAIEELETYFSSAKSKLARHMINKDIAVLKKQVEMLQPEPAPVSKPQLIKQTNESEEVEIEDVSGKVKAENDATEANRSSAAAREAMFKPITTFAWDQDGYSGKNVFIYVTLNNVGSAENRVTCEFTKDSFDLKVMNLDGLNYRLYKQPLHKEIVPEECKFKVKKDRVVVTLRKIKGEYGADHWSDLLEKNKALKNIAKNKADPSAGLMDMMKQMYDEGDDQMKRTIGEAMMKSRQEKNMPV